MDKYDGRVMFHCWKRDTEKNELSQDKTGRKRKNKINLFSWEKYYYKFYNKKNIKINKKYFFYILKVINE